MRHIYSPLWILVMLLFCGLSNAAAMDESPWTKSRAEAQAMCEKAAALIKSEGIEKATASFQDHSGPYYNNNHYVYVFDQNGKIIAHGAEPLLIGLNGNNLRDIHNTPLVREILKIEDRGWVDYMWADPSDGNRIKPKSSYIIHTQGYFVGVGYYKNPDR